MRAAGIALALALAMALGLGSTAPAAARRSRVVAPAPALERAASDISAVAASAPVSGAVVLEPRGGSAALTRFIAAVSDRSSSRYGGYLQPGEFARRFGPPAATVGAVEAGLRAGGLHVASVSRSRMLVRFSGTAGNVRTAFDTSLRRYRLADGTLARGTASAIRLPAGLAGSVAAVVGLDAIGSPRPAGVPHPLPADVSRHPAARSAPFAHPSGSPRGCSAARTASVGADGLTDDQIANAYGAFGLYGAGDRGAGQRIALYENEPFLKSDIRTFDTCYFGASRAAAMIGRLHVIAVDGGQPTGPGSGEASLDVEDISALAPGASIDVYEGPYTGANPNDYDSLDEYAAIVDADRDHIVSTSWGLCEQSVQRGQPGIQQAENLLFEQAAAQGQTVFSAAGDNGSDDCNTASKPVPVRGQDPVSVDDPSSQPYVVAVGGTAIDDAGQQPPVEQVWNGGPTGGAGGGGISQSWQMPSWQRATTVPGIARPGGADYREADAVQRAAGYPPTFCHASACRLVPDVSAQADAYTGSISVYSRSYAGTPFSKNGWTTTGGTSSSAPIWAAMLALVNASPTCTADRSTTAGVGFVTPQLYALASDPARYRASFHDVTAGNNDVDGLDAGRLFAARAGFDLASGLGSPQLTGPRGTAGLAYYLCAATRARPVVSGLSPSVGGVAGGVRIKITGSGFGPRVSGVQVGTRQLAHDSFQVLGPHSIVATLPPAGSLAAPLAPAPQDGAGPANVVVTVAGGASSAPSPRSTFDYVDETAAGPAPSISAVKPYGGLETAPRPVTILGSGFDGATEVTFGGVRAASFRVAGPQQITVTPPAYSSATACAPLPATGAYVGEDAGNDICQVHVAVINPQGSSHAGQILAPPEGPQSTNALGDTRLGSGCGCEGVTAPDEYDYVPAPRITSVSTSGPALTLASERGTTLITVRGVGLNPLTLDWATFGDPARAVSQDTHYAYLSGTEMQIVAPAHRTTVTTRSVRLGVRTLAGQSPSAHAVYAGVPRVQQVVTVDDHAELAGVSGAADVGGTEVEIRGSGFARQLSGPILFAAPHGVSAGTEYRYQVAGGSRLVTATVAQTPGLVDVSACTVSGCSPRGHSGRLWLYAPGDPTVTAVTPGTGPAAGATRTEIQGSNLGCPLAVYFGDRPARKVKPGKGVLDCGATQVTDAVSPPGPPGSTVPVSVATVESYFTGSGRGTSTGRFSYTG